MQSNKIEMHKKYRTRSGLPVRVICVDRKDSGYPVVALIDENGHEFSFYASKDGRFSYREDRPHPFDLVEVSEWDDFKQDDKVLVSEDGKTWYKRYFNKVIEGVPYAFDGGITSWTADAMLLNGCSSSWKFCKKAEV